jgi:flavodoxin I
MKSIGIFYGSSTGNTATIAKSIAQKLNEFETQLHDVAKATADDLNKYDMLILGTSTWGYGDLQDDWESFFAETKEGSTSGQNHRVIWTGRLRILRRFVCRWDGYHL